MKYWIGIVTAKHVRWGVEGGFCQLNHGQAAPLKRLHHGDWLVYYSHKESFEDPTPVQQFTAIGQVSDDEVFEVQSGDRRPWRRRIDYKSSQPASIRPLLDQLSFTAGQSNWGFRLRFGLVEITKADFELIAAAMQAKL